MRFSDPGTLAAADSSLRVGAALCVLAAGSLLAGCPSPDITISLPEAYAVGAGHTFPGLVGIPNLDDDNENGEPDWDEAELLSEENDLASLWIRPDVFRGVKRDQEIYLSLLGDALDIRLWRDERVALGQVEDGYIAEHKVLPADEDILYQVEFRYFLNRGTLRLELREDDVVLESDEIFLTSSPLILNHHLQETEEVWLLESDMGPTYNNRQMVSVYEDVLGDMFTPIDGPTYSGDPWVQDEFQFGWTTAPGLRNEIVVDSIRDRPLDRYPEDELEQPDWVIMTWGDPNAASSLDYFGNLEVSPPLTVDGQFYPFGRIYFGGDDGLHPDRQLTDFLASQVLQHPFQIDTTWLCVSHIDEISSFVPDPTAPKGFRFVWSDTASAWDLLESMDGSTSLGRFGLDYPQGHELPDVDAFLDSNAIRYLNDEIQEDYLDPLLEQMKEELALDDEDILLMPSLFEEIPSCGGYVAALIPGMVNLFVVNRGEQSDVFLADPFTRPALDSSIGQDEDPFISYVKDMMPAHINFHFVDNWSIYHMGLGEVHCGSNATRTPSVDWWEVAGPMLEEAL